MLPQVAADAILRHLPKRKLYGVDAPPPGADRVD
jgi:hypothetical protein